MRKIIGYTKGVNLGGWLSQGIFTKEHLETFIQEKDIIKIKSWGLDHLRLPVDFENLLLEDGSVNEYGFSLVFRCLDWCKKYGLNVVIDLHKTPGYIFDDPTYSEGFFHNEKLKNEFLRLWDIISKRVKPYKDMIMLEMLNEVTSFDVIDEWNELGLKCIDVIRNNISDVKILFGGVGYSAVTAVKYLPIIEDKNVIYNIHCYEPLVFTHQGAYWVNEMPKDFRIEYPGSLDYYLEKTRSIDGCNHASLADKTLVFKEIGSDFFEVLFASAIKICEERDMQLYCGEYGVIELADNKSIINWYKDINTVFEKYNIGRAAWSFKKMDFDLEGPKFENDINELIKYL